MFLLLRLHCLLSLSSVYIEIRRHHLSLFFLSLCVCVYVCVCYPFFVFLFPLYLLRCFFLLSFFPFSALSFPLGGRVGVEGWRGRGAGGREEGSPLLFFFSQIALAVCYCLGSGGHFNGASKTDFGNFRHTGDTLDLSSTTTTAAAATADEAAVASLTFVVLVAFV